MKYKQRTRTRPPSGRPRLKSRLMAGKKTSRGSCIASFKWKLQPGKVANLKTVAVPSIGGRSRAHRRPPPVSCICTQSQLFNITCSYRNRLTRRKPTKSGKHIMLNTRPDLNCCFSISSQARPRPMDTFVFYAHYSRCVC
jgi:hypothetical protein